MVNPALAGDRRDRAAEATALRARPEAVSGRQGTSARPKRAALRGLFVGSIVRLTGAGGPSDAAATPSMFTVQSVTP